MMFACAFPLTFAFATLVYNAFCGTSTMCFFFSLIFCLELALQFGMIMMKFHNLQNNITEIRTDALKLLAMLKRPVPRATTMIGAWLNIFQVLNYLDLRTILS